MSATISELRRQALAQLSLQIRRTRDGFVARGPGAPGGRHDLIARTPDELRLVLADLLGRAPE